MNLRSLVAGCVALCCVLGIVAVPASVLRAAQVVQPTGAPIALDVSKGAIIRLDRPCSSVFVADPAIADVQLKSPTVLYIMGKAAGETTVYAVDQKDAVLLDSRVEVRQDIDRLQREIQQIDPTHQVRAKAVDDSIVLEGPIKDAAEGDDIRKIATRYLADPSQLVNELKLDAPNQIDLQVRVAEVQRTVLKQFGINWSAIGQNAAHDPVFGLIGAAANLTTVPTTPSTSTSGFIVPDLTLLGNQKNNNLFASYQSGQVSINTVVDALAQQGLITILAEPNLVTVSGQKASFLAGGEFPVPVPQAGAGAVAITIDWKQFGVSLNFTPTILGDGRIALHVAPEVSELAPTQGITIQGFSVPGITTRRADTTVELGSGQTFAIAGLLQNATQQQLNSYPWIGDIPIIGSLFRSTAFQRGETELVILITPYLVQPVSSATALATGMEKFYAPTDKNRVLNGELNSTPSGDPAVPPAPANGAAPPAPATGAAPPAPANGAAAPAAAVTGAAPPVPANAAPPPPSVANNPPPAPELRAAVATPASLPPSPIAPSGSPRMPVTAPARPAASGPGGYEID